jgi:hypothetical protein
MQLAGSIRMAAGCILTHIRKLKRKSRLAGVVQLDARRAPGALNAKSQRRLAV